MKDDNKMLIKENPKICISLLNADYLNLEDELNKIILSKADCIHLDIMDGNFVPEITFGKTLINSIKNKFNLPVEAHLMISNTDHKIASYAETDADTIIIHAESCIHIDRSLSMIKANGKKAGIALNPATPVEFIENVIDKLDIVLIMTVNPGFGGQEFLGSMIYKIQKAKDLLKKYNNLSSKKSFFNIEVDGGINEETIKKAKIAGANHFVIGKAFFDSSKPEKMLSHLKEIICKPNNELLKI